MVILHIANTVSDLIQGDVQEHLPLERIPLRGDVLGLGTTTSLDNGELAFLQGEAGDTAVWKSRPADGGAEPLAPGSGLQHFPYVCFTDDATALRHPVPAELLAGDGAEPLMACIGRVIETMNARGTLPRAPLYGLRLISRWDALVITVASKLCHGEVRRNDALASRLPRRAGEALVGESIYERLPHFLLAPQDPCSSPDGGSAQEAIRWLGASLRWDCCGFWDGDPASGRVTVPVADQHLHLHGCSTDLRFGGHLHHEHPRSSLAALERLVLYPLQRIASMASDLAVRDLHWDDTSLRFTVANQGTLDASRIGVAVVIDDRYSDHRYLRLPWLAAGEEERFAMPLPLAPGRHELRVIVDPEKEILEAEALQANNAARLVVAVG